MEEGALEAGLEGYVRAEIMPLWSEGTETTLSEFPHNFMRV